MTWSLCKFNSTQNSTKNLAGESWSTIPGISTLRCLLNGQDQDKPAQVQMIGRFHTLNDKKNEILLREHDVSP